MPKVKEGEHTEIVWTRVDMIASLILENDRYLRAKRAKELTAKVMQKFKLSERSATRYIRFAKKEIRTIADKKKNKMFEAAIRAREYLLSIAKSGEHPDLRLALEIMKDRDELYGLYEHKVKHTGNINLKNIYLDSLTDEQLIKLKNLIKGGVDVKDALLHIGVIIK